METSICCIHVCFIDKDLFGWVAASHIVDTIEEACKSVSVVAGWELVSDDAVVATETRGTREGAVVGGAAFQYSFVVCVDSPLDCNTKWSDRCTWDVFNA